MTETGQVEGAINRQCAGRIDSVVSAQPECAGADERAAGIGASTRERPCAIAALG